MSNNKKKSSPAFAIVAIILIAVIVFCAYKVITIKNDYDTSIEDFTDLADEYVSAPEAEELDSIEGEIEDGHKWYFEDVDIDFAGLKKVNPEIIGWIRFDDPEAFGIDYPILYNEDTFKYLHSDIYGNTKTAGSIFLDGANSGGLDLIDRHMIVYGHNMKNGSMFGTLKKYRNSEDVFTKNQYFTVYTEGGAYRYKIFSVHDTKDDGYVYSVGYAADQTFQDFIDQLTADSMYDAGMDVSCQNFVMTLSTCSTSGDEVRFVVHAVCADAVFYE